MRNQTITGSSELTYFNGLWRVGRVMMTLLFITVGVSNINAASPLVEPSRKDATSAKSDTLAIDITKSSMGWWAHKVTGEHHGTVKVQSGYAVITKGKLVGGKVMVDMSTITDEDIESPEWNARLVGHLKSDDFFSAAKHPVSVLELTKIVPGTGDTLQATADMTIKGITHQVSFPIVLSQNKGIWTASGVATLDRTLWDIRYRSGKFFPDVGDKLIYDDFKLIFNLVTQAQPTG